MALRSKLAIGTAAVLAASLGLWLVLLASSVRAKTMAQFEDLSIDLSALAEVGLENAMMSRDPDEIVSVLQAIGARDGIMSVEILGRLGNVKYTTRPQDAGRILSSSDPTCVMCHNRPLTERPQTVALVLPDGKRILRVARPLLNQPRCMVCHADRVLGMLVSDFDLTQADEAISSTMRELSWWTVLTILGVFLAGYTLLHFVVVRPLDHFLQVTQAIARGNIKDRVELAGRDEIAVLAQSFDEMVHKITVRTQELETLNAVAGTVSRSLELDQILELTLDRSLVTLQADGAAILLLGADGAGMSLRVHQGICENAVLAWRALESDHDSSRTGAEQEGMVGRAISSVRVVSAEIDEDPAGPLAPILAGDGFVQMAAVPLVSKSAVLGVLCLATRARRALLSEQADLLTAIGQQVGMAIDNARLHAEMKELAITDGLTGLFNRRHFYQVLEIELARNLRYDSLAAFVMIDLDGFKAFNDTHGHVAGDRLLQQIASLLCNLTRDVDTIARYGGEEFAILLPNTDRAGACVTAERIRAAVEQEFRDAAWAGGQVTISAGIAMHPEDAATAEELVHTADMALYRAKHAGKNRVCVQ